MIQLSIKKTGLETLRLLAGAALLYGLLFAVNSLPFLWPEVFPMASPAHQAAGILNALLALLLFVLLRRKSTVSLWEYGLSLVLTGALLLWSVDPVDTVLAALLESRGASFEFVFSAAYHGTAFVLFWAELELIALALVRLPRLLARRSRNAAG